MSTNSNKIVMAENNLSIQYKPFVYSDTPASTETWFNLDYSPTIGLVGITAFKSPRNGFITGLSYNNIWLSPPSADDVFLKLRIQVDGVTIFTTETIQIAIPKTESGASEVTSVKINEGELITVDVIFNSGSGLHVMEIIAEVELNLIKSATIG